jgi:ATP-dependent DNA helicase RecG
MALHINIEDLLSARAVESDRIEYKEGWNPDAIYRSICAFANDFENIGGGYILVGVAEDEISKTAKRPVKGLITGELADIQRKMIGFNNLLMPVYHAKLFIEEVDGKLILVLWIPGGTNRPYQVPEQITATVKRNFYYIRKYANSVKANLEEQQDLISLANQVPFDDRANTQAKVENISMVLVKDYLKKIQSRLADEIGVKPDMDVLGQMELVSGPNEHVFPRNVGLMVFSESPEKHFPSTQVELVYFPKGEAEEFTEYDPIKGTVPSQIKRTLEFLTTNFLKEKVIKPAHKAESNRTWNYPLQAIEEILVNAFYHRDYQQREPIEIRIYANSIIFINHGGPDRSIQLQAFNTGQVRSRRYRNRRLGEFLKELELTEGRATGIPTILKVLKDNGSPAPNFKSDDDRTYFEVEIFIHPEFAKKETIVLDLDHVNWDIEGINKLLVQLIDSADGGIVTGIASNQASNQADFLQFIDIQIITIIGQLASNQASTIAGIIAGGIAEKQLTILMECIRAKKREDVLSAIKLSNQRKNYVGYMLPLVELHWLTMTIPDKPTSPNQKYLTILKGRVILEFLKHKTK